MNTPKGKPDAEWIASVRAQNRARQGMGSVGADEGPSAKQIAFVILVGLIAWKLLP